MLNGEEGGQSPMSGLSQQSQPRQPGGGGGVRPASLHPSCLGTNGLGALPAPLCSQPGLYTYSGGPALHTVIPTASITTFPVPWLYNANPYDLLRWPPHLSFYLV